MGRREIGRDVQGTLCSTAQADETVYEIATVHKTEAPCTRRVSLGGFERQREVSIFAGLREDLEHLPLNHVHRWAQPP